MHATFPRRFVPIALRGGLLITALSSAFAQVPRQPVPTSPILLARPAERRAIVEGLSTPMPDLKIVDLNGRDVSNQVRPRTEGDKLSLDFSQRSAVVLKSRVISTLPVPSAGRMTLPGGVILPRAQTADPAVGSRGRVRVLSGVTRSRAQTADPRQPDKPVWLQLTFAASPMPAPWDNNESAYTTMLTFGLQHPDGAPPTLPLEQPVIVKLAYQGLTATEVPTLAIAGAGLEHEKTIALRFHPQTVKPTLLVRSSISDVNLELTALPRLLLQPARKKILGLGLEVVSVAIASVQPNGRSQPVERDTPVLIQISGQARATSEALTLREGESNTQFAVRSAGLGAVAIQATADGVSGLATLHQKFPTGPLLAALVGGALGGFARRFVKGARRTATTLRVVEGLVLAAVVFVAGVLGVGYLNLPPAVVATEAGAFLTAALGGFLGVTVFEKFTKKAIAA